MKTMYKITNYIDKKNTHKFIHSLKHTTLILKIKQMDFKKNDKWN